MARVPEARDTIWLDCNWPPIEDLDPQALRSLWPTEDEPDAHDA